MLDPKRDLDGATPEALARALLRPLRARAAGKPVVRDEISVEQVPADETGDAVSRICVSRA